MSDLTLAAECEANEDFEGARDAYRRAIASGEGRGGAKLLLLDLLDRMHDNAGVLELADDLDGVVRSAGIAIARARAYLYSNRFAKAIEAGRDALARLDADGGVVAGPIGLKPADAYFALAKALRHAGDAAAAIPHYRRAIELEAGRAYQHAELAYALNAVGDNAGAAEAVECALDLDPDNGDARYNLACYRALLGDKPAAIRALVRSIELQPENAALARDDSDLASLHGEPAFVEATRRS